MVNTVDSTNPLKISCEECGLAKLCLPQALNTQQLAKFETLVNLLPMVEKNGYLARRGDPTKHIYAVKSGAFRASISSEDGELHISGFYLPGELIGFDAIAPKHYQMDIIALEDSRVCELHISQLDALCEEIPELHREMCAVSSRHINGLQQLLMMVSKRPVDERIAVFILGLMERYRARGLATDQLRLPMTRNEIANYLGMAPETLSRQLKRLASDNILSIRSKQCTINDEAALRSLTKHCAH